MQSGVNQSAQENYATEYVLPLESQTDARTAISVHHNGIANDWPILSVALRTSKELEAAGAAYDAGLPGRFSRARCGSGDLVEKFCGASDFFDAK